MTETESSKAAATTPAAAEPTTTTTTTPALPAVGEVSSWKLPVGIEDHLEAGMCVLHVFFRRRGSQIYSCRYSSPLIISHHRFLTYCDFCGCCVLTLSLSLLNM
jgi:hypothetical protein